jgi:hypothetical protein
MAALDLKLYKIDIIEDINDLLDGALSPKSEWALKKLTLDELMTIEEEIKNSIEG